MKNEVLALEIFGYIDCSLPRPIKWRLGIISNDIPSKSLQELPFAGIEIARDAQTKFHN